MKTTIYRALLALSAVLAFWVPAMPAHAQLKLCNNAGYVVYAAVGVQQGVQVTTRGWLRIVPGDCQTAVAEPLKAPAYFVYARSPAILSAPPQSWGGQFRFCVKDGNFSLAAPLKGTVCKADSSVAPFGSVPTNGAPSWTMSFTETPPLATPADARDAGTRRYLAALGYPVANPKALTDAEAKFRAKMKLTPTGDLFAALEAHTKGASTPKGYAVCNDGSQEVWTAIAFWSGKDFVSRGWWNVAAGSCAAVISEPLGHDAIYLYASRAGNNHLVTGPSNFCTSNQTFEIHGRDSCEAHGNATLGFTATNAKGAPGYVAHISDSGLVPDQPSTPK